MGSFMNPFSPANASDITRGSRGDRKTAFARFLSVFYQGAERLSFNRKFRSQDDYQLAPTRKCALQLHEETLV